MVCVEEDHKTMGVRNWRENVGNTEEWCRIVDTHIVVKSWIRASMK